MIFQYPSFLWALGALAIPIIIHLFNFRKTTRIYFSNTRFLKQVKQETTQKRKLKQFLVLASRLLFLFFLVMAFAQPFLPATDQVNNQKNISVYLDNSLSMSAPVGEKTRALDAGIQMVQEVVQTFPSDVRYQLITNDFAPFSNSFKTKSEVLDFLSQVRTSAISRKAEEVTKRLLEKNTLFWISDFQRSTFGNSIKMDSSLQVKLVPVKYTKLSNVFVDSVYLENPFVIGGEKNPVKVRLRNAGEKQVEGLVTKLSINSIQASAATVNLEPNSSNVISFDLSASPRGVNKATLSFSDYPVSFDNEFYFTLNYSGKLKIIEIKAVKEITSIERVYGNKELFSFSSFQASNLNYSLLAAADLVIVNGLNKIEPSLQAALTSYKNSNSLLVIPSQKPDVDSYQNLIGLKMRVNAEEKIPIQLNLPDFQNPLLQNVFEEKNSAMSMPAATKLLDWGTDRSSVLQFKDGRPFLSQVGNVFLLASPLEKTFTDFYNHALFVPLMYRIAALGKRSEQRPYYSLSSTLVSISADSLVGEEPIKMQGKQEVIPLQRRLGDKVLLEMPKYALDPGFYTIAFKEDTLDVVAFNLDKSESILESLTGEEAKTLLGGGNSISIFNAASPEAFRNEIKERYLGTPLWKYAVVLALLFLLIEVLLLRFLK
jgi:Aerotolerance regulator N-terminal